MKFVLSTTAVIFAVLAFGCSGEEGAPVATSTPGAITTPGQSDRDVAIAEIESRFPGLMPAIQAVESEDADAILDTLRWEEFECTPDDHRGGIAPRCAELGVPVGTPIPMFHYQLLSTSYFTEVQMRERIDEYLLGANPSLALVAAHPDGRWLISFIVDDPAGEGLRAVDFHAAENGPPLTSHQERFAAATPLDSIREEERDGVLAWEILYTSPALLEWDAEKDS